MIKDSMQLRIIDFANKHYEVMETKFNSNTAASVLSGISSDFMDSLSREDEAGMLLHYSYYVIMLRCFQANLLSNHFLGDGGEYKKALDIINGATNQGFLILEILSKAVLIDQKDLEAAIELCLATLDEVKGDLISQKRNLKKRLKHLLEYKGVIIGKNK